MKYLAAYLLLVNAGNASPSAADITKVLESVSIEVEADKVSQLLEQVEGKNVEELIAEGTEKLSSVHLVLQLLLVLVLLLVPLLLKKLLLKKKKKNLMMTWVWVYSIKLINPCK